MFLRTAGRGRAIMCSKLGQKALSTAAANSSSMPEVKFESYLAGRIVTLNRPAKLNSLNLTMVDEIAPRLREWAESDTAKVIIIKGEGEKAFCAGGDVAALAKGIADNGVDQGRIEGAHYFQHEYTLNHQLATYDKPIVALIDGITMGGGVGMSVHAPFQVATERTLFAMPETTIGFFPDVGASFFLPRLDGQLGMYLGLTSSRLKGHDVVFAGIATHFVPSSRLADLEKRLCELENSVKHATNVDMLKLVNSAIDEFSDSPPDSYQFSLGGETRKVIDDCFGHDSIEEILTALDKHPSEFAAQTKKTIVQRSPTSLKATVEAIRRGSRLDIQAALTQEYHLAQNFVAHPDFVEGVSARLLSKPAREPVWKPDSPSQVSKSDIQAMFTSIESLPTLEFVSSKTFDAYPHKFGLPSEASIKDYVIGESSGREYKATRKEVIEHFVNRTGGKLGVEAKVTEALDRNTRADSDGLLDWIY